MALTESASATAVTTATTAVTARAARRGRHKFVFWLALSWLVLIAIFAAFAEWLPLADPEALSVESMLQLPSSEHLLGTDGTGRDILARIVHGTRVSVVVSVAAVTVGLVVGGTLGIIVGFFRGRLETLAMAGIDVILAFPGLVLLLALVAFVGQSLLTISLVIGFLSIPVYARVARATTLSVARREFVLAARAMGARPLRLLVSEVLPNVILPLLAYALVATGVIVVLEGSLAFLGLSIPPPAPTWGSMIAEGKRHLDASPHVTAIPAVVMFLTVLSLNLVGDRLRSRFDVREANVS
jgi:peptide/nickel transport system permease protein